MHGTENSLRLTVVPLRQSAVARCCIRYFSTHFTSVDQWRRPPPFHRLGTVTDVVVQSSGGGSSRRCVPWFAGPCLQRKLESALLLRPVWRTHRTCSRRVAF